MQRGKFGVLVLFVISIAPILIWIAGVGIGPITSSLPVFIASLGKAAALSGITLYCIMPVLSMRWRLLDSAFGGLDKLYKLHSKAGKIAFFLILAHPVFLGLGRMLNGLSFTKIWDWSSLLVLSGIFALIFFVFVTGMSVYSHIRHQHWIWVHRIFGVLIPVFFIHALLAQSQLVKNKFLLVYLLTLGLIGFSAFLYRSVFSKYLVKKHKYVVQEIYHISKGVSELVLKPIGTPIVFEPGQFAFVSFDNPSVNGEAHPYSFSNANNGPYVRFTIKALGDDTSDIQIMPEGTRAYLEGPFGTFSYKKFANKNQVWIAGGVGITPFLSMARSFRLKEIFNIHFFYGTETEEDAVFLSEFRDITELLPNNFTTHLVPKDTKGFITAELLKASLGELNNYDFLICGPPMMMRALSFQLKAAGVHEDKIHIEDFSI